MSLFQTVTSPCPVCKVAMSYDVVHSVNIDRRPDLRDAIMDRSFQRELCPSCGQTFRTEPEFTYVDVGRKQFLTIWPSSRMQDFVALEKRGDESFNGFYGPGTSPVAEQMGREFVRRTVFGWEAAREKLTAAEAGIDDVTLELAKIALQRWTDAPPIEGSNELRLIAISPDQELVLGIFEAGTEALEEQIRVPKDLIAEIEADPEGWQVLREQLSAGSFVDMQRLILEPAA